MLTIYGRDWFWCSPSCRRDSYVRRMASAWYCFSPRFNMAKKEMNARRIGQQPDVGGHGLFASRVYDMLLFSAVCVCVCDCISLVYSFAKFRTHFPILHVLWLIANLAKQKHINSCILKCKSANAHLHIMFCNDIIKLQICKPSTALTHYLLLQCWYFYQIKITINNF